MTMTDDELRARLATKLWSWQPHKQAFRGEDEEYFQYHTMMTSDIGFTPAYRAFAEGILNFLRPIIGRDVLDHCVTVSPFNALNSQEQAEALRQRIIDKKLSAYLAARGVK